MPIYVLTEHSNNYSKTSGSLWQYHRDGKTLNDDIPISPTIVNSKSYRFKKKLTENILLLLQKMLKQRHN